MKIRRLLQKTRSYRRFRENRKIPVSRLARAVENVRFAPSPANLQPVKYRIVTRGDEKARIFPLLKWAGYLKDWDGPGEGQRPAAYILILGDRSQSKYIDWDYGIGLMTILLSLREQGIGACTIAACDREEIKARLRIEPALELAAVIAAGIPDEKVVIEEATGDKIKYYRDQEGVHHVPKRPLAELLYRHPQGRIRD